MSCPWQDDDFKVDHLVVNLVPLDERRAHVGNLPWRTDDRALEAAFTNYGARSAEVVVDRETGRSRGFGFVAFEDSKSMGNAIQGMNGQELAGRNITVNQANPQHSRR